MITNRSLRAALLATALALPAAPALTEVNPPFGGGGGGGMNTNAANAVLPDARNNLGAGAGNGVNVVTDYGADPTGVADATTAFQNAVTAACNSGPTAFQTKDVFVPNGLYLLSGQIDVANGCWIHGSNTLSGGKNAGGAVLRVSGTMAGKDLFSFHGFGQFKLTDMRIDKSGQAVQVGGASYARIHTAGTGYAINDTITLTGGTFTTATVLKVTAVTTGAVTGAVITTPGIYSVAPTSTAVVAQGSTSGAGTGATFDMMYDNAAAVSLSGPKTILTADSASGASTITVATPGGCASVAACFANGNQIEVEQDNGLYLTTTINGTPAGQVITLAAPLTFKASANHPVYNTYANDALIENLVCTGGWWDCERRENAVSGRTVGGEYSAFSHDGVAMIGLASPDTGAGGHISIPVIDSTITGANAAIEVFGGGTAYFTGTGLGTSNYGVLFNAFVTTGTWTIANSSLENSNLCAIRVHQAVSGAEFANISVTGNEFSNISGASLATTQRFCVDTGTPNTNPKWVRNIVFSGNRSNDYISGNFSLINVQDGDNIVIAGNALNNNNVAGPTAISIGGAATRVLESGNQITLFPTGAYGTMQASSLSQWRTQGQAKVGSGVDSTSTTTGDLLVPGGAGFAKALFVGGLVNFPAGNTGVVGQGLSAYSPTVTAGAVSTSAVLNDSVLRSGGNLILQSGAGAAAVQISTGNLFGWLDTSAAFYDRVVFTSSTALTADRTLTLDMVNGARTLKLGANLTIATDPGAVSGIVKSNGTGTFAAAVAADIPATTLAAGTSVSLTAPRQYYVCTGTCTVTPPVPAAGYEFCVMNDDNVATVITLAALGSSARYENTARTAYGTAGTGTYVSGGAVGDKVCILGRDSTHYLTVSFNGTGTVN